MGGRLSRSYWDFNARSAPASKSSRSTREVAIHAEGRVCSIYLDIFVWGAFRVLDLTTLSVPILPFVICAQFVFRWEVYHDWGNSSSNDVEENRRKSRTYVNEP